MFGAARISRRSILERPTSRSWYVRHPLFDDRSRFQGLPRAKGELSPVHTDGPLPCPWLYHWGPSSLLFKCGCHCLSLRLIEQRSEGVYVHDCPDWASNTYINTPVDLNGGVMGDLFLLYPQRPPCTALMFCHSPGRKYKS